jgi:hypothetical protein
LCDKDDLAAADGEDDITTIIFGIKSSSLALISNINTNGIYITFDFLFIIFIPHPRIPQTLNQHPKKETPKTLLSTAFLLL